MPTVDVLLKVTLVLGIAWVLSRALARGSAAARHQVWAVALASSLAMPFLAAVLPQWTIAVLPAPATQAMPAESLPAASSISVTPSADRVFEPVPALNPSPALAPQPADALANPLSTTTTIWMTGVLLVLARLALGTARVWWIAHRAAPASGWAPLGHRLAQSLGLDRHVTFLSGEEDAMPMAFGLLRANVLLPAEADRWALERQRVVLLHELAHVKRRDGLTQLLAHIACAAYWFNPLVWLAAHQLRAERERACDDLVLAAGTRGSDYADHLLDIARSLRSGAWPTWSAVTMAHRSQLEGRLMAILDPALPRRSPNRRSVAVFTAIAVVSLVCLASVRPVASAAEPEAQGRPTRPVTPAPAPLPPAAPAPAPNPVRRAPRVAVMPAPAPPPAAPAVQAPAQPPQPPIVAAAQPPQPPVVTAVPVPQPAPQPPIPPGALAVRPDFTWYADSADFAFAEAQQDRATPADPKITAALTAALKDENEDVRKQALHTLVRMRAPIPPDVIAGMLKDKSPDMRKQAIFVLGQQRDPKNVGLLADALKDSDPDMRKQAAFALSRIRDPRAVDPLIVALKDSDVDVRKQAAFALGQMRDARAVDALIAALKDNDPDVRQQAVFALGQIR
jgi:beta-lactamase regulating signal transducer with metallopeptidase domain